MKSSQSNKHQEEVVETVPSFLGVSNIQELSWHYNTSEVVGKPQQRLYFLRKAKESQPPPEAVDQLLQSHCRKLLGRWHDSLVQQLHQSWKKKKQIPKQQNALEPVVKTAQDFVWIPWNISTKTCYVRRARNIIKDIAHLGHNLFRLLPSEGPFRSIRSRTNRLKKWVLSNCHKPPELWHIPQYVLEPPTELQLLHW